VGNSEGYRLLIQTDSFITQLTAITSSPGESGSTRVGFHDDLVLPEFLATKKMMVKAQWPTWEADPDLNQHWSDVVYSQGKVFRSFLQEVSVESLLVTNLFEGWTGSTSARSSITRKPVLVGPRVCFPIYDDKEEVVLVDLVVASFRRR
jgi:hypothetical protein